MEHRFKIADIVRLINHDESAGYITDIMYSKFHREPAYYVYWFNNPTSNTYFDWNAEFYEKYLEAINEET